MMMQLEFIIKNWDQIINLLRLLLKIWRILRSLLQNEIKKKMKVEINL